MTNKIGFFGASVTQQQNGYTYHLSKKLNVEHICFGYGGNHIKDAGICCIDEVIKKNLNYCFIDFFSTGYISTDNKTIEYLDTIIYKFTKSECKLVFLFFLNSNHKNRIQFYKFLYNYLTSKKIYFIDINDHIEYSSMFCRDNVHTTDVGSIKYSDIIYNVFQRDKDKIILSPLDIVKTKYCDNIKTLCVNKSFQNSFFIEGE